MIIAMDNLSCNSLMIKEININLVKKTLKEEHTASIQGLAKATGLSVVTIHSIINILLQNGEVFEVEKSPSSGGRPAQLFRFNHQFAHAAILYAHEFVAEDTIFLRIVDLYGDIVTSYQKKFTRISLQTLEMLLQDMFHQVPSIQVIGLGLPGVEFNGQLHCDYPDLNQSGFLEFFRNKFQKTTIFENDVNAACLGYCRSHQIDPEQTVLYLFFPKKYCPGTAIFCNGKIHKGFRNFAGEIRENYFHIPWTDEEFLKNENQYCSKIAQFIIGICAILSPHVVVLSGTTIQESYAEKIIRQCKMDLDSRAIPKFFLTESFHQDFENGMIETTLNVLEPNLFIQKK